jgi:hypothetical protein
MKILITEDQYNKLIMSEQMGVGFWAEQVLWGINPESPTVGGNFCMKPKGPREVFIQYYNTFKNIGKVNNDFIKKLTTKLKTSMEGANLSSNKTVLDFFKNNDDITIGSVISNWKTNTKSPQNLYQWLGGETLTSWNDIMKSLSSNPKIKNKKYNISYCNDSLMA